jgi:hypothetical protein
VYDFTVVPSVIEIHGDSAVGIVTGYGCGTVVLGQELLLIHVIETGSGADPASC